MCVYLMIALNIDPGTNFIRLNIYFIISYWISISLYVEPLCYCNGLDKVFYYLTLCKATLACSTLHLYTCCHGNYCAVVLDHIPILGWTFHSLVFTVISFMGYQCIQVQVGRDGATQYWFVMNIPSISLRYSDIVSPCSHWNKAHKVPYRPIIILPIILTDNGYAITYVCNFSSSKQLNQCSSDRVHTLTHRAVFDLIRLSWVKKMAGNRVHFTVFIIHSCHRTPQKSTFTFVLSICMLRPVLVQED